MTGGPWGNGGAITNTWGRNLTPAYDNRVTDAQVVKFGTGPGTPYDQINQSNRALFQNAWMRGGFADAARGGGYNNMFLRRYGDITGTGGAISFSAPTNQGYVVEGQRRDRALGVSRASYGPMAWGSGI